MSLAVKKVNYIFKPLNLNTIVDKLFSCVVNPWRKASQAGENKYLTSRTGLGGEHNILRHTQQFQYCK